MISDSSKEDLQNLINSFSDFKISDNLTVSAFINNEDHTAKLPPEILLHIFKFLPRRDLQRSVGIVNHRWHQLVRDPTLLKVMRLSSKAPLSVITNYIEQRPLLTVLKASGLKSVNETIERIVTGCPFLVCLDIGFCDIFHEAIISICQYGHNLRHINLEGVPVDHEMIELLCTYLPNLEILNLSHCSNLTDQTIYAISEKLRSLKAINIDGIQNVSDYGIIAICNRHAGSLHSIWIDGFELSAIGLLSLTLCGNLSFLSISYADGLADDCVLPIRSLRNLRYLTVHKATELSKAALLGLFHKDDSQLTKLVSLDLNECSVIDDEVLAAILALCGRDLRFLSLQWCWNITDEGLCNLVEVCTEMERLSLIGNHVIKGTAFRWLPDKWGRLVLLNLTNCNQIDDDLLNAVARQMPSTYIFDYFGERFSDGDDNVTQYEFARAMEKLPICEHL